MTFAVVDEDFGGGEVYVTYFNSGEFRYADTGEEEEPEHDLVLDVVGTVDTGVEPAEFLVGEELGKVAASRRTGEAESFTGDLGGFDEGVVVDAVTTGTVDEFTDEGFTHREVSHSCQP